MSNACVVIENGSNIIKAGRSVDECPQFRTANAACCTDTSRMESENLIFGDAALFTNKGSICRPIERGQLINDGLMIKILDHVVHRLNMKSTQCPLMITQGAAAIPISKEKLVEGLFEGLRVPKTYLANQSVMQLYANAHTTGLVVDSGHSLSYSVPVYEGFPLPHATRHSAIAGGYLTTSLQNMLAQKGLTLSTKNCEYVKHKACVAEPDEATRESHRCNPDAIVCSLVLPDKQEVSVGFERIEIPELLVDSGSVQFASLGLGQLTKASILLLDPVIRGLMLERLLLAGPSMKFENLRCRFLRELDLIQTPDIPISVVQSTELSDGSWYGSKIVASLEHFNPHWLTASEYREWGSTLVHRKCLF